MPHVFSSEPPEHIRQYVMVLYWRGDPDRDAANPEEIFAGHMAFLNEQGSRGMNLLSGPFGDDGPLRGISIYNSDATDVVEALVAHDPAVVAGHLIAEVRPWFGVPGSQLVP